MTPIKRTRSWPERFWAKVDKTDTCWLWTGTLTRPGDQGYGQVRLNDQFPLVHRVAYEMLVGPIPDRMQIDHLCKVRRCVNPAHLEPVTNRENTARGDSLNGRNARKTHCKRGHELSGDNLRMDNGGRSRRCRQCVRDRSKRMTDPIPTTADDVDHDFDAEVSPPPADGDPGHLAADDEWAQIVARAEGKP